MKAQIMYGLACMFLVVIALIIILTIYYWNYQTKDVGWDEEDW